MPKSRYGGGYAPCRGSREHPHLQVRQWFPYYRVLRAYIITKIQQRDRDALLLRDEATQVLQALHVRPQHIRNGSPQARADALLANVYHQQLTRKSKWLRTCKHFPASLVMITRMMAVVLCARHSGLRPKGTENRPRWLWVQIARSVYHKLLRADRVTYSRDDGHGNISEWTKYDRLSLRSWNVCKRLSERLEPVYQLWLNDHGNRVVTLVFKQQHCSTSR